jgi:hypothetical protein
VCALLQLCQCSTICSNTTTELFKDATFLGFPVTMGPVLEHSVKVVLCFLPALFDCGYEILFVSMAEKASDIGVLKRLQGREYG